MTLRLATQLWGLWEDRRAQDLLEYALAAAFVAVTVSAFFPPAIFPSISTVFSKIDGVLAKTP